MAGVKETPRQRMIGMMYLVLTALLALQVSNQILQKFVLINDGMERTSRNFILKNESTVGSIEYTVEQQGNKVIQTFTIYDDYLILEKESFKDWNEMIRNLRKVYRESIILEKI